MPRACFYFEYIKVKMHLRGREPPRCSFAARDSTVEEMMKCAKYAHRVNFKGFDYDYCSEYGYLKLQKILAVLAAENIEEVWFKECIFDFRSMQLVADRLSSMPWLLKLYMVKCELRNEVFWPLVQNLDCMSSLQKFSFVEENWYMLDDRVRALFIQKLSALDHLCDLNAACYMIGQENFTEFCRLVSEDGFFKNLEELTVSSDLDRGLYFVQLTDLVVRGFLPRLKVLFFSHEIYENDFAYDYLPADKLFSALCHRPTIIETNIRLVNEYVEREFDTKKRLFAGFDGLAQAGLKFDVLSEIADVLPKQQTFTEFVRGRIFPSFYPAV